MLKVSILSVTCSRQRQIRKLSFSLIVFTRIPFLVFMIRFQFFHTGTLHLLILFIELTSKSLKILSSFSDHFEIISDVTPTPVCNSFVCTVVISKRKYDNDSERNIWMTNSRIFDFFWVYWKLSLEMFVVQEASLSSCDWSATVVNRCSLQQKNMLMISLVSSFELQMIHPCLLVRSSRDKIIRWWITRLSVSVSINLNWRWNTQYYVLCTMSFLFFLTVVTISYCVTICPWSDDCFIMFKSIKRIFVTSDCISRPRRDMIVRNSKHWNIKHQ